MPVAASSTTTNEVVVVQEQEDASLGGQIAKHNENWVVLERVVLKLSDRNILLNDLCLNDKHIFYVQLLIKKQFPSVLGLKSTLIAERHGKVLPQHGLQVLLVRDNHWILLSTMGCPQGSVKVYDSTFINQSTCALKAVAKALITTEQTVRIAFMDTELQPTATDCGIYVAAMMTTIAYGGEPCYCSYDHKTMRSHLAQCFEDQQLTPFQSSAREVTKVERSYCDFYISKNQN